MAVNYTPEQRSAIEKRDADILVSAAAGSGKTAVLAERILSRLADGTANIDDFLCLTFTEAAAAEMREKIYNRIAEYTEHNPADERMAEQLKRLRKADISTIDSFIGSVVKQNCHLVDTDPNYRIITEGEVLRLQLETLDELFKAKYAEKNTDFFMLIERFCPRTDDKPLKDLILEVYGEAVSMPFPQKWLDESAARFDIKADTEFSDTLWGNFILKHIETNLQQIRELTERALKLSESLSLAPLAELCAATDFTEKYAKTDILRLRAYLASAELPNLTKTAVKSLGDDGALVIAMYNAARDSLGAVCSLLASLPLDNWRENIIALKPTVNALTALVSEFTALYSAKKKERRLAEFDDISHFALNILIDENGCPTPAAANYQKRFKEVIVDEYQDCSFLQDAAIEAVSGKSLGRPNRFMVGDIKQSIYKFRKANPEIFANKYREFGGDDPKQCLIQLNKNFRSRKNILDTTNFFFYQLMTNDFGDVDYNEDAALHCGANYSDTDKKAESVEICLINTTAISKDSRFDALPNTSAVSAACEAVYIADRIKKLLDGGFTVEDPKSGTKRPAEPRDIVILFRTRSPIPVFADILNASGIPVITEKSISLFDALEVSMLVSFLKAADNPLQDIHLLTMLFSPAYNITPNELVDLSSRENNYLYENITEYQKGHNDPLSHKLEHFLSDLSYFSSLALRLTPMSELLEKIYLKTGLYNYVGLLSNGAERQQNLDSLADIALEFDKNEGGSLYTFIAHLDALEMTGVKKSAVPSAKTNSVTAMTMHQSKGLEFPIVFLPQMCSRFKHNGNMPSKNKADVQKNKNIALSQELGIGMKLIDPDKRTISNTLTNMCIAHQKETEEMQEALRILYVAMTRAKEKLFMVGACVGAKALERALSYVTYAKRAFPAGFMLNASYYMDWLVTCLARSNSQPSIHLQNNELFYEPFINNNDFNCEFYIYDKTNFFDMVNGFDTADTSRYDLENLFKRLSEIKNTDMNTAEILGWIYPFAETADLPSKLSISEIKKRYYEQEEQAELPALPYEGSYEKPEFTKTAKLDGASRGTIYHTVMEHIDFNIKTYKQIEEYMQSLVKRGILTEDEIKAVRAEKIHNFLKNDICKRIAASPSVSRETAFTLGLTPYEVYGVESYKKDTALIHIDGIIDLFFEEGDGIVLLDYKTDRIGPDGILPITKRYKIQLDLYAKAIERATGKKVTQKLLYLFAADTAVEI